MKTKCYSVRLQLLQSISNKAYKCTAFDGSTAIIPKSQYYGRDYDVQKSDAHWIAAWILEKSKLQYSRKKEAYFDKNTGKILPTFYVEHHIPERKEKVKSNEIQELKK